MESTACAVSGGQLALILEHTSGASEGQYQATVRVTTVLYSTLHLNHGILVWVSGWEFA